MSDENRLIKLDVIITIAQKLADAGKLDEVLAMIRQRDLRVSMTREDAEALKALLIPLGVLPRYNTLAARGPRYCEPDRRN